LTERLLQLYESAESAGRDEIALLALALYFLLPVARWSRGASIVRGLASLVSVFLVAQLSSPL